MRVSPLRSKSPLRQQAADGAAAEAAAWPLQPPGPGLRAVAASLAALAADLQGKCRQEPLGRQPASAFAALLGLLAPLAPHEATAMARRALVPALHAAGSGGGRRLSSGASGERLGALLRLALATLQAGLVEVASGAVPASAALGEVPARPLFDALRQAWSEGAPASAEDRALALAAGLAAVQAEVLDPSDLLELLQKALEEGRGGAGAGEGGASGDAASAAAAAAVLLPTAACIGASKEHPGGSHPRGTQGGRRKAPQHHPPSPTVTALQQLLGLGGETRGTPAALALAARGLGIAISHAHEPVHLALAAVDAAMGAAAGGNGSACAPGHMLQWRGPGAAAAEGDDFRPSLTASMSEWVRAALEQLTATELPADGQVALVDATATFLQRGAQGQLEHARPLVQWLLRAAASPLAPVRGAVLRCAPLLAEPQVGGRHACLLCASSLAVLKPDRA